MKKICYFYLQASSTFVSIAVPNTIPVSPKGHPIVVSTPSLCQAAQIDEEKIERVVTDFEYHLFVLEYFGMIKNANSSSVSSKPLVPKLLRIDYTPVQTTSTPS